MDCCAKKYFQFVRGDICDYALINTLISESDLIIPLAAIVGAPACKRNPSLTRMVNFDAHMNIVNNLSKNQKVLFPTTNSGYGIGEKDAYCTEESP